MKALVKKYAEEGLWLEDVPIPEIAGNEVLIKIHKTAICGTDVHIYNWDDWAQKTINVPMVSGHEYAGEIVEIGANVTGLNIGDIVRSVFQSPAVFISAISSEKLALAFV